MNSRIISDITDFIFVSDSLQPADIIFMPGGSDPTVPEMSAVLYNENYAEILMPSGGVSVKTAKWPGVRQKADIYTGDYQSDCEFYTDVLVKNGVPRSSIIGEDKSRFTKENAFFSRKVADENGLIIKKAIICCKSFHARRCLMLYGLAFPETELLVKPVDVYGISRETWHQTEYGIDRVLGELARCGNQFVDEIKAYLK